MDKNLRTMGTENSRQIQIRISGHHFLRGGGVLLHQLLFVCRTRVSLNSSVVAILCFWNLGWNFFVIWICSIFVPSPISGLPEFEVTRLGVWGYSSRFLLLCWKAPIRGHISLSPIHFLLSDICADIFNCLDLFYICYIFTFWGIIRDSLRL